MTFQTDLPDSASAVWARDRGFSNERSLPELAHLDPLKKRLLEIGGWAVILMADEPDLAAILDRGMVTDGESVVFRADFESQCHYNVAMKYLRDRRYCIETGYALSRDGRWRQHSWAFDKGDRRTVETTEGRIAYFGVRLDDVDAIIFCARNVNFDDETERLVCERMDALDPETRARAVAKLQV